MAGSDDVRDFLMSRRARVTPHQAGLPAGGDRRVPGLRRTEVASLAGISIEYYTRLERGSTRGVSDDVLDAVGRALQLDDVERAHLFDLVRANSATRARTRRPSQERVRPSVQHVLDRLGSTPAFVRNGRLDILATNALGEAVYGPVLAASGTPPNSARFMFLDPSAREFFVDWPTITDDAVGILRVEAGRDPYDRRLTDLIGELSTRSDEFRRKWAAHDVRRHEHGVKRFHHPLVGDLHFQYEAFDLPADPGQRMLVYTCEANSPTEQALALLASWTAPAVPHGG